MAVNPHLAGDMRRDLEQLQLLYELNSLSPERFDALFKSMGQHIHAVEHLVDELQMSTAVAAAPGGKVGAFQRLKAIFDDGPPARPKGLPVTRMRFVGHLGVIDCEPELRGRSGRVIVDEYAFDGPPEGAA